MSRISRLENVKMNLGQALTKIGEVSEKIRTASNKWIYIEEKDSLKESIKRLGGELTQLGGCGDLTAEINRVGQLIFDSIAQRIYVPYWDTLVFLPDETIKKLRVNIQYLELEIKERLKKLAASLSGNIPTALDILEKLFPEYYANLTLQIDESELSTSKNYYDTALQKRFARIVKQADIIPESEKAKLDQYAEKAHSGYEISDFDFNVTIDGSLFSLHFVIKSGKETKGKANEEKVWYQITRPIEEGFDFSIFIASDGMTAPLENRIKKYNRNQCDYCLEYIVEAEVARLLKSYDELN